jgi:UDP-N-acetylglucosamine 2-epimerase
LPELLDKNRDHSLKIVTILGARPQFIKAASVSRAIQQKNQENPDFAITEVLVHTGQHYDENMSQVFFDELEIQKPHYHLGVGSGSHGKMTGIMLEKTEEVLVKEVPDLVLVYGDTNSTLAGALAAVKLHLPVGHVEAGLRSFNRKMPEEINRILTDHVSSYLFCPTDLAVNNLIREGIRDNIYKVGDVMYDSFLFNKKMAGKKTDIIRRLNLVSGSYCLVTVHRQENTDNEERLANIFHAFDRLATPGCPFIIPLHPRTEKALKTAKKTKYKNANLKIIPPVSYLDMVTLETKAKAILTDSGGVQKEAFFSRVPCITLRDETEWVELVDHGFNRIASADPEEICRAFSAMTEKMIIGGHDLYGGGRASERIVEIIVDHKASVISVEKKC